MHIVLLFTYGYSLQLWQKTGSLERELKFYTSLLKSHKVNITFVTYGDESDEELVDEFNVIPIYKFIKKRNNKFLEYLQSLYYPILIYKKTNNFDLIKQNQLMGSWVAIILKLISRKKLFIRTGYDMYEFSIKENKKKSTIFFYKLLTFISLKFADLYSVSSLCDMNFLNEKFKSTKLEYRPNWVAIEEQLERNFNDKKQILSVGRLENQKNYFEAIDSLIGSDCSLTIYGNGSQKNQLLEYAKKNNVHLNIHEPVSYEELLQIYKNFDYFISTSKYEGNPKVILEAQGSGSIVIVKDIPNNLEIIENGINGFIYKNPLEIQKIITKLNNNKKLKLEISSNSIKRINEINSFSKLVDREILDFKNLR